MKIGIVGAGQAGATAAYSMMMSVRRSCLSIAMRIWRSRRRATFWTLRLLPIRSGSARASLPILMARVWSCLLRGLTEAGGEPTGSAVPQRRNLLRDRAGSVGGGEGPEFFWSRPIRLT
jgi:hypothetical protein